jgi:two-component system sensor histidine kinase CpxA
MTKLYLKIFFTFWLITTTIIIGTNIVVHWFDVGPKYHFTQKKNQPHTPAERLLFQVAGNAVGRNTAQLTNELKAMPEWSLRYLYVIDQNNQDLLKRPLPPGVLVIAPQLSSDHPYEKVQDRNRRLYGRLTTLNDGHVIRVITIAADNDEGPDRDIILELFLQNIWPFLLVSILFSGTACFILAKYFTKRLRTLQEATHKIAKGDFSVRVSESFAQGKDEIAELGRDFDNMTARLEKAMDEQRRLIKDVSHELRSPLARLQIALAIAQQKSTESIQPELEKIKQAADYLNSIITEILAIPVQSQAPVALDDVIDLISLLETLIENYAEESTKKSVEIHFSSQLEEALVKTRSSILVGVFENILRNALLYTPKNSHIHVNIDINLRSNRYRISISDQGPGVPEENIDDIFEPFFRTDQARARESGGFGLGLAIAQRTVSMHQGAVYAENNHDKGLTIFIEIPQLLL